jgi:hypothetical protein
MDKLGADPGQLLRLISGVNRHLLQNLEAQLRPSGLCIEQFRVLEALHAEDGLAMGELAARVFVDSPTLTCGYGSRTASVISLAICRVTKRSVRRNVSACSRKRLDSPSAFKARRLPRTWRHRAPLFTSGRNGDLIHL